MIEFLPDSLYSPVYMTISICLSLLYFGQLSRSRLYDYETKRQYGIRGKVPLVAPGLGLGVNPGLGLYRKMLEKFEHLDFYKEDGSIQTYTMIPIISELLRDGGLCAKNEVQCVEGVWVYPCDYFNPLDAATGKLRITPNTRSIHWYTASWLPAQPIWKKKLKQWVRRFLRKFE